MSTQFEKPLPLVPGCMAMHVKGCNIGKVVKCIATGDDPITHSTGRYAGPGAGWWFTEGHNLTMQTEDKKDICQGDVCNTREDLLMRIDGLEESEQESVYQSLENLK